MDTVPYDSRPTNAAAKVRRAWGTRRTAAYEGRPKAGVGMWRFLDGRHGRGTPESRDDHGRTPVPIADLGGPYAKRRNMRINVAAGAGARHGLSRHPAPMAVQPFVRPATSSSAAR
ncbi:hypothetical protein GCM10022207_57520 [Streptomyces lannensis]|uniref:Transposase n=1 Tax=Streptomyces lannensis TaxID=766498 RepID=A0ABP7KNM2_9ACTN